MGALLTILGPALLPVLSDGIRNVIARFTGSAGARPQNVAEVIQLMNADTAKLQALSSLDAPGAVSQWVANVRALQRPVAVLVVIGGYMAALSFASKLPAGVLDNLGQYAQMVTFYLFGDRTYTYLKAGASK